LFKGQFTYSVDAKGRLSIPAKLRKYLTPESKDTLVMTQGTISCIDVYPLDTWEKFEGRLLDLNPFKPIDAKFIRMISQHATEDSLDSQSRILVPQALLKYAKIDKEVLILGALKKIELWNPEVYAEYLNETPETYEQIAAQVMAP
jgi:MraZ protein